MPRKVNGARMAIMAARKDDISLKTILCWYEGADGSCWHEIFGDVFFLAFRIYAGEPKSGPKST